MNLSIYLQNYQFLLYIMNKNCSRSINIMCSQDPEM
jgi:hypothetical protein